MTVLMPNTQDVNTYIISRKSIDNPIMAEKLICIYAKTELKYQEPRIIDVRKYEIQSMR